MKKIYIVPFAAALALAPIGCTGGGGNTNQANAGATPAPSATPAPAAQTTPLPQFTDPETAFAEGNKLFDANQTELAVEAYNQAVKLNPEFAEAWFKLGVAYALIEKQNEIDSLNEEVAETPTPTPAKKSKGKKDAPVVRTKDSEKAFEKAVAAYKKIVAKNAEDDLSFYNLGRAYNKLDEDEDAEKALRQAVKLKPEETLYQTEFGAILIKLARYDEAVKALKKALDIDPENSEAAELLEKAEAGKKRINFGVTPKPPQPDGAPKSKTPKADEDPDLPAADTPQPQPQPQPPAKEPAKPAPTKTAPKPVDKKGN